MNTVRVLLLGGGTGGHIYPLVAVAEKLKEATSAQGASLDLRYFGAPGNYAAYLTSKGITVSEIASSKLRRYFSISNILDIFRFGFGLVQALFKLYFFMPDVVFSKSGPGVLPIIFAARWYRIPVVIHESDAVPGITNKLSARHAEVVEVSFEEAARYFEGHKNIHWTGSPVRSAVIPTTSAGSSRTAFGLAGAKPIVFIVGGSQGAQSINEFVLDHVEALLTQFEIIHQVGAANYDQYAAEYAFTTKYLRDELKARYKALPFLNDEQLAAAFGAADVVISRAGSSLFEIAANGKPSILVPLASSANNHQYENAYAYAGKGAAVVIEEENLLIGLVINQLQKMTENKELSTAMATAARSFYKPAAAETIARDVLTTAGLATV
jgi:UDP-N-acetylglucosamine--N-acetylmuramyl-(pentapeptide) pyrophosphoryl-undecaprenol N-acetylglucosamine transferase